MENDETKYVVVSGNPFDGMTIYGTFDTHEDAQQWAGPQLDEWWVLEVKAPE
jgi:hypothetical protein